MFEPEFQSGATSENHTLNLSGFTSPFNTIVLQYNTHIHWSEENCSSRGGLTRAGTSVIIKCFGVSRVERPLIDIFWNKDQPHLLCHSLRWRGNRPFCALGSIFPLCSLLPQNSSLFSSIGALYFSPVFPLWISKTVWVNWQRNYFFERTKQTPFYHDTPPLI